MIADRNKENNRTEDMLAYLAVRSMREGVVPTAVEAMERSYHQWLGIAFNDDTVLVRTSWYTGLRWWLLFVLAGKGARIFRRQVEALAIGLNKELMAKTAASAQQENAQEYARLADQVRDFHKFLYAHFQAETVGAEARKISNFDLAKEIMLGMVPKAFQTSGSFVPTRFTSCNCGMAQDNKSCMRCLGEVQHPKTWGSVTEPGDTDLCYYCGHTRASIRSGCGVAASKGVHMFVSQTAFEEN